MIRVVHRFDRRRIERDLLSDSPDRGQASHTPSGARGAYQRTRACRGAGNFSQPLAGQSRYDGTLMTLTSDPSAQDRFRGCILGHAVADALGAPFETMPADAIYYGFGFAPKIVAEPPVDVLCYTDDTQMMIGVAECLVEQGEIRQADLMSAFVRNFDPSRAYGPGTHQIIECAADGSDWAAFSTTIFPGGSLGNGAAMRVSPVGLMFHDDLERTEHQAAESARPTHSHPVGIDGARIMAIAVAMAVRDSDFDVARFYDTLIRFAQTDELREALVTASKLTALDGLGVLGTSLEAHRSVPTAIACFASYPDSYPAAVGRAIGLGGDTDTIAAMAGALCGARLGAQAIPSHLLDLLEDGSKGRSYIDTLAQRLYAAFHNRKSAADH